MNFLISTRSISSRLFLSSKSLFSPKPNLVSYIYPSVSISLYSTVSLLNHNSTPKLEDPFEKSVPQSSLDFSFQRSEGKDSAVDCPRPAEIPFQKKVSNLVKLIGCVKAPVEFKVLKDGKCCATTVIAQENKGSVSLRIPLIFQGDLANIAAYHLKEEDCVYIDGQLSTDPSPFTLKSEQSNLKVMVHDFNFVEGSPWKENTRDRKIVVPLESFKSNDTCQKKEPRDDAYQRPESVKDNTIKKVESTVEFNMLDQSVVDLITNPDKWWDIRSKEFNSASPAFEHKVDGKLVHIDDSMPDWIRKQLECLKFDSKIVKKSSKADMTNSGDVSTSWRDLLKNPKQWHDHRENKLLGLAKPKFPDFKNKDSGASLWLNSAPDWVLAGLEGLEFDVPIQKGKKADDNSWKDLVEHPEKWWDNRSNKKNPKSPDFKHKELGTALWLSDSPAWASSKLPPLKA